MSAGVLIAAAGTAAWLRQEAQPRERDYHAVRREFDRIEREIHDHDMGLWLVVERAPHDQGPGAAAQEERHRQIRRDLEKLSHAGNFTMTGIDIRIDGDRAHLHYTLQSSLEPWRPLPSGGTMEFVRRAGGWVLDDHRFTDQR